MRKLFIVVMLLTGAMSHAQVTLSGTGINIGGPVSGAVYPESYGAVGNGNTYFDGVLSASSNVLTSATAAFPSNATGDLICIWAINGGTTQQCGTITGRSSATSVTLSFSATSPTTGTQFAYGTSDQAAFNSMLASTACSSTPGCAINLGMKGYVLSAGFTLPPNVTITISGKGFGVNNTANSFINSNAKPNANVGTRLMFLTTSMTGAAFTVGGTLHVTSTAAFDTMSDFSIYGGTGYGRDGGGTSIDCLDVLNWQGFDATNVGCFNFSGNARYVDSVGSGGFQDYTEAISFHHFYASYNGGAGLKMGSSNATALEATLEDSGIIEANGGPAFWLVSGGIVGFTVQNDTFQWNNVTTSGNTEIVAVRPVVGCQFRGNYAESDSGGTTGSQSTGIYSASPFFGNSNILSCDLSLTANYFNQGGSGVAPTPLRFSAASSPIPTCATKAGVNHVSTCVSDSTACTNGTTYTSGGSTMCRVDCNGTNWIETGSSERCN